MQIILLTKVPSPGSDAKDGTSESVLRPSPLCCHSHFSGQNFDMRRLFKLKNAQYLRHVQTRHGRVVIRERLERNCGQHWENSELATESAQNYTAGLWPISVVPGILFGRGSTNSIEDRGQRERGSGSGSPLVRGSAQFVNE
jgi:hypothetical protein